MLLNPHSVPITLLPVGKVVTKGMILDEHEFLSSRFYQEFVKPQGIFESHWFQRAEDGAAHGLVGSQSSPGSAPLWRR